MNLPLKIAWRYLVGKKSTNAINVITGISVFGISVGTAALILILSVFNGFESLISSLLNDFNPDLKVTPIEGKFFKISDENLAQIKDIEGVNAVSKTLEEIAFFEYKGAQVVGAVKGVDENYQSVNTIDSSMRRGTFVLKKDKINYGVLSNGLNERLAVNQSDALTPIKVYMPSRKKKGLLDKEFKSLPIYPSGIYEVQSDNEYQYMLTSLPFASKLIEKKNQYSALEINMDEKADEKKIRKEISTLMGNNFDIKNRYQQDEAFLKLMNIEKWISYLIVCLTMFIVAFNLLVSLWMIVLDKKKDISILQSLGLHASSVKKVFVYEGLLICGVGVCLGIFLSLLLYFLQSTYGVVPVPEGFIIDAYPIQLRLTDFLVVVTTVMVIGFLASLLPSSRATKVSAYLRHE